MKAFPMFASEAEKRVWRNQLSKMQKGELTGASISQFSALHVLTRLLEMGANETNALSMLNDFAESFSDVQREQIKRGTHQTPYPATYLAFRNARTEIRKAELHAAAVFATHELDPEKVARVCRHCATFGDALYERKCDRPRDA